MPTSLAIGLLASQSILFAVASTAVILRLLVRRRTVSGLGSDDWLILVALLFAFGLCVTNIVGVPVGRLGTSFEYLSPSETVLFLKFSFAWQFFYVFAVAFIKLSALTFYARVFKTKCFLLVQRILLWVVSTWLVAFFWATLFQAVPIYCNWDNCDGAVDYPVMYLSSAATDIALDCIILSMPIAMLNRLEMDRGKKLAVGCIFGLGVFCVVASVARLVCTIQFRVAIQEADFSANFSDAAIKIIIWSGIEACASIICACLPCFGPYLTKSMVGNRLQSTTLQQRTPAYTDDRFTGGTNERGRSRRLRLSNCPALDTSKPSYSATRGRRSDTVTSSVEHMLDSLPSPLMTPKIKGPPTFRDCHEPEIEMGTINLRTGSHGSMAAVKHELV